jgi:hypothetical protein
MFQTLMGDVAVYVVLGGGPVRGGAQDSKRSCLTGRGCFPLVREEVGGQRSLWPTETLGPRWRVVALPILPGFAGVERHHVHAMQLEQFNLGNRVPHYSRATSGDSVSLSPAEHGRLAADRAGATQSAHRGGGPETPPRSACCGGEG